MVLPALTLTLAYLGEYMIIMRSSMLDTVQRGLPPAGAGQGRS